MISDFTARAMDGELGRELTFQEIEDELLERQLEDEGWFSSPAYTVGQIEAEMRDLV